LNKAGQRLKGVPNGDLGISLLIALAPNTAAGFARLNIDPRSYIPRQWQNNQHSHNNLVKLPDPQKFETAFDDAVLNVPLVTSRVHLMVSITRFKFQIFYV